MTDHSDWQAFLGKEVVVDTNSSYVYLGVLSEVRDHFVVLKNVDVHDRNETPTTKEQYVMDAKRFGIKSNRKEVSIRTPTIVSLSKLEDVILY